MLSHFRIDEVVHRPEWVQARNDELQDMVVRPAIRRESCSTSLGAGSYQTFARSIPPKIPDACFGLSQPRGSPPPDGVHPRDLQTQSEDEEKPGA
ncbi:MAG: hypothetical protein ABSA13_18715 [Beijerinckiaceae bacterium]|jgi:hypothetical protein